MGDEARERRARLVGVAFALAAMALAVRWIGWPAPAISVALGYGATLATRPRTR